MFASNTSQVSSAANYIEDVFSTYLYTGNGSTQTITNGIDFSGKGGLLWIKNRTNLASHAIVDTARGSSNWIQTNTNNGEASNANIVTGFNSNGFGLGNQAFFANSNGDAYVSWSFRKQPKFFDVVTYTGNGANRTIAHNLGSVPGCIIIKQLSQANDWQVYHRSLANTEYLVLNSTAAKATNTALWNSTTPTSTVFSLGTDTTVNSNNATYVAYLFAHDAGGFGTAGTDNVISCGSFTTDGSGNATVSLGYEPQWILVKRSASTGSWAIIDNMRGFSYSSDAFLYPNLSNAEFNSSSGLFVPTATGFNVVGNTPGPDTFIYIAIRRGPMKTPTSGTSVYSATTYSGNGSTTVVGNLKSDLVWMQKRNGADTDQNDFIDRLRGDGAYLKPTSTAAEAASANFPKLSQSQVGVQLQSVYFNSSGETRCVQQFARAPGFMDVVCYTGTGTFPQIVKHNLGVQPEFVIIKGRNDSTSGWVVGVKELGTYPSLYLNGNNPAGDVSYAVVFESTNATDLAVSNNSGINYTAWMWATLPGISKVGKYTGTGTTLQINCGFTGGARFVLIKRTDSTGDWYVWDTARGIVSGNDPYLLLNSTAAETTSTDYIDAYSAGFEISSTAPAAINASGGTFIYMAIS